MSLNETSSLTINDIIDDDNDEDFGASTVDDPYEKPTLESILNETDIDDYDSLSSTIDSTSSPNKHGIICKSVTLKQIEGQLSANSVAGLPIVLTVSSNLIAVGTSHAYVFLFDTLQILKIFIKLTKDGSNQISALSFNNDSTRILIGDIIGTIYQYDTNNGKLLRKVSRETHQIDTSIIHLKYTDVHNLAVFSDSSGSVFTLEFKRTMAIRAYDAKCIFSGSRGEVCCIEPLRFHEKFYENLNEKQNLQNNIKKANLNSLKAIYQANILLAMASFTKLFIIRLKPDLNVLFTCSLPGSTIYLPLINWQFVIINYNTSRFNICPILAYSRESTIKYLSIEHQVNNELDFKFLQVQTSSFDFIIINFCWLNAKTLCVLDANECIHIVDVRTNDELQVLSLKVDHIDLVYQSSLFKCTSTGGYVSPAFSKAGDNACYHSFISYLGQLFILGTHKINLYALQNWSTRIDDYVNDNRLDQAIDLCLSMYNNRVKALVGLPMDIRQRKLKISDKLIDLLYLYMNRHISSSVANTDIGAYVSKCIGTCIEINRFDLLFGNVYELLCTCSIDTGQDIESHFYTRLVDPILNRKLAHVTIPPLIIKKFINFFILRPVADGAAHNDCLSTLEKCILNFNVYDLDIDELMRLCKQYRLFDVLIFISNKALNDYRRPFVCILNDECLLPKTTVLYNTTVDFLVSSDKDRFAVESYNKLLVYLSTCLSMDAVGTDGDNDDGTHVRDFVFDYLIEKTIVELNPHVDYPLLRFYMNYNILDFLNIITLLFQDFVFELNRKHEFIRILTSEFLAKNFFHIKQFGHIYVFLAKQYIGNVITIGYLTEPYNLFAQIVEYLCVNGNNNDGTEWSTPLFHVEYEQTLFNIIYKFNDKIDELNIYIDLNYLIGLLFKAKYYTICEYIYELKGEFHLIIDCYLNQNLNAQLFDVIDSIIDRLYETNGINQIRTNPSQHQRKHKNSFLIKNRDIQLANLRRKLLKYPNLVVLLDTSPKDCAQLLWVKLNIELKSILNSFHDDDVDQDLAYDDGRFSMTSLNSTSSLMSMSDYNEKHTSPAKKGAASDTPNDKQAKRLNYKYKLLTGLFELIDDIKVKQEYMHYLTNFASNPKYIEIYIELMCMHESDRLLDFLKTTDYEYRIGECLVICKQYGIWNAYAFLLEKDSQITEAYRVYIEQLNKDPTNDTIIDRIIELFENSSGTLSYKQKEALWFDFYDYVIRLMEQATDDKHKEFIKNQSTKIINTMVSQNLNLNAVISKILLNSHLYSDIKQFLIKMIDSYTYERTLLQTTTRIFNNDLYRSLYAYKKTVDKPFSSKCMRAYACNQCLTELTEDVSLVVFNCGHVYHKTCMVDGYSKCPICAEKIGQSQTHACEARSKPVSSVDDDGIGESVLDENMVETLRLINYGKPMRKNDARNGQLKLAPSNLSKISKFI